MNNDIYAQMEKVMNIDHEKMAKQLVQHRYVPLLGRIEEENAQCVSRMLFNLDWASRQPITLLISSSGGDVHAGNLIIDTIRIVNSPVNALVMHQAGSMAIDILLACKERKSLPLAEYFLHFKRSGFKVINDTDELKPEEIKALQMKMVAEKRNREHLYVARLKKNAAYVDQLFALGEKFDLHYTADQAKEMGLIDGIVDDTFKLFPSVLIPPLPET